MSTLTTEAGGSQLSADTSDPLSSFAIDPDELAQALMREFELQTEMPIEPQPDQSPSKNPESLTLKRSIEDVIPDNDDTGGDAKRMRTDGPDLTGLIDSIVNTTVGGVNNLMGQLPGLGNHGNNFDFDADHTIASIPDDRAIAPLVEVPAFTEEPVKARKAMSVPLLANTAIQILMVLSQQPFSTMIAQIRDKNSEVSQQFGFISSIFVQLYSMYMDGNLSRLMTCDDLGFSSTSAKNTVRLANLAWASPGVFGATGVGNMYDKFFDLFLPDQAELTPDLADLFLGLRTQMYIQDPQTMYPRLDEMFDIEPLLRDRRNSAELTSTELQMIDGGHTRKSAILTHTGQATTPLSDKYSYDDFLAKLNLCLYRILGSYTEHAESLGIKVPVPVVEEIDHSDHSFDLDISHDISQDLSHDMSNDYLADFLQATTSNLVHDVLAGIKVSDSTNNDEMMPVAPASTPLPSSTMNLEPPAAPQSTTTTAEQNNGEGSSTTPNPVSTPGKMEFQDFKAIEAIVAERTSNYVKTTLDGLSKTSYNITPSGRLGLSNLQGLQGLQGLNGLQSLQGLSDTQRDGQNAFHLLPDPSNNPYLVRLQTGVGAGNNSTVANSATQAYYTYAQTEASQPTTTSVPTPNDLPPNQSCSSSVLYDKARQAALSKSSSHTRREGVHSTRRPWTQEEEKALMDGLDMVKGPHWSQILTLYGANGTISSILKDRTQVQLKDKARNLKLFFLKTNSEMPYYLQAVTGELKTRAPTQAARKEAEERARQNEDNKAKLSGLLALQTQQRNFMNMGLSHLTNLQPQSVMTPAAYAAVGTNGVSQFPKSEQVLAPHELHQVQQFNQMQNLQQATQQLTAASQPSPVQQPQVQLQQLQQLQLQQISQQVQQDTVQKLQQLQQAQQLQSIPTPAPQSQQTQQPAVSQEARPQTTIVAQASPQLTPVRSLAETQQQQQANAILKIQQELSQLTRAQIQAHHTTQSQSTPATPAVQSTVANVATSVPTSVALSQTAISTPKSVHQLMLSQTVPATPNSSPAKPQQPLLLSQVSQPATPTSHQIISPDPTPVSVVHTVVATKAPAPTPIHVLPQAQQSTPTPTQNAAPKPPTQTSAPQPIVPQPISPQPIAPVTTQPSISKPVTATQPPVTHSLSLPSEPLSDSAISQRISEISKISSTNGQSRPSILGNLQMDSKGNSTNHSNMQARILAEIQAQVQAQLAQARVSQMQAEAQAQAKSHAQAQAHAKTEIAQAQAQHTSSAEFQAKVQAEIRQQIAQHQALAQAQLAQQARTKAERMRTQAQQSQAATQVMTTAQDAAQQQAQAGVQAQAHMHTQTPAQIQAEIQAQIARAQAEIARTQAAAKAAAQQQVQQKAQQAAQQQAQLQTQSAAQSRTQTPSQIQDAIVAQARALALAQAQQEQQSRTHTPVATTQPSKPQVQHTQVQQQVQQIQRQVQQQVPTSQTQVSATQAPNQPTLKSLVPALAVNTEAERQSAIVRAQSNIQAQVQAQVQAQARAHLFAQTQQQAQQTQKSQQTAAVAVAAAVSNSVTAVTSAMSTLNVPAVASVPSPALAPAASQATPVPQAPAQAPVTSQSAPIPTRVTPPLAAATVPVTPINQIMNHTVTPVPQAQTQAQANQMATPTPQMTGISLPAAVSQGLQVSAAPAFQASAPVQNAVSATPTSAPTPDPVPAPVQAYTPVVQTPNVHAIPLLTPSHSLTLANASNFSASATLTPAPRPVALPQPLEPVLAPQQPTSSIPFPSAAPTQPVVQTPAQPVPQTASPPVTALVTQLPSAQLSMQPPNVSAALTQVVPAAETPSIHTPATTQVPILPAVGPTVTAPVSTIKTETPEAVTTVTASVPLAAPVPVSIAQTASSLVAASMPTSPMTGSQSALPLPQLPEIPHSVPTSPTKSANDLFPVPSASAMNAEVQSAADASFQSFLNSLSNGESSGQGQGSAMEVDSEEPHSLVGGLQAFIDAHIS